MDLPLVGSQVTLLRKCFVTDITDFRLLTLVYCNDVGPQLFRGVVTFGALVARVLPFSTMCLSQVPDKLIWLSVTLVTLWTRMIS